MFPFPFFLHALLVSIEYSPSQMDSYALPMMIPYSIDKSMLLSCKSLFPLPVLLINPDLSSFSFFDNYILTVSESLTYIYILFVFVMLPK